MTLDDMLAREEIRDLMARYTVAGDRLQTDAFVAVFTEDGILESEGVPEADTFRYAGHDELRNWLGRWTQKDGTPVRAHQATFIRHHMSTSLIELTGDDSARARTYWTAYTDIGTDHCGVYVDGFRKTGGGWRIAHRRVRLDWRSKESLFTNAVVNTKR